MFVTAIGLFIYLPFISVKKVTIIIDIEGLWRVGVNENEWEYVVLHHSATGEGNASKFDRHHRKEKKWKEADKFRDKIEKLGYVVQDSSNGPVVRRK